MPPRAGVRQDNDPLSVQAYEKIFSGIQTGVLKPGSRIREAELTLSLGMSRTPLREALLRLQADGLIVPEAQRGIRIVRLSQQQLGELFTAREWAEAAAASLAARHAGEADIAAMRRILALEEAASGDPAAGAAYNRRLHALIHDCARNRYLATHLRGLTALMALAGDSTRRSAGRYAEALAEHGAVIDAIERHDAPLAESRMREHIRAAQLFVLANHVEGLES